MNFAKHLAGALLGLGLAVSAQAAVVTVTPDNLNGWTPANLRGTGTVEITATYPANGNGSLQFSSNGPGDKADFANSWGVVQGRTLGNISALSYDYLRDPATAGVEPWLVPALRLQYLTTDLKSGYLIFEPVYNGTRTAPTGSFVANDVLRANFWMRAFGPGRTIEQYDVTLARWASGATFGTSQQLSADTNIIGIEVGVGSGWAGQFRGAVDNVSFGFGATDSVTYNFETRAVAVPEPASALLLASGMLALVTTRRRRA